MKKVSPFIKWVGGKSKLILDIDKNLPELVKNDFTYVEPFLGGGAVFFHLISNYKFKKAYLNDLNTHLINTYIDLRDNYMLLCKFLILFLKLVGTFGILTKPSVRALKYRPVPPTIIGLFFFFLIKFIILIHSLSH